MHIALVTSSHKNGCSWFNRESEFVVAHLLHGLKEKGHQVTLIDSAAKLRLNGVDPALLASDYDVIHSHVDFLQAESFAYGDVPRLTTLHAFAADAAHDLRSDASLKPLREIRNGPLVAISETQRQAAQELNWVATVYNGVPLETFAFKSHPGQYLAFWGCISPDDRPDLAIRIAIASGVPLKMVGSIADQDYFQSFIKPHIDHVFIDYLGEPSQVDRPQFFGKALALLVPGESRRPFALAAVEALTCGTPVLARPFGANAELSLDGVTGYVRESVFELAALVMKLESFDRSKCRIFAENHFSLDRMCDQYLSLYQDAIEGKFSLPERSFMAPVVQRIGRLVTGARGGSSSWPRHL